MLTAVFILAIVNGLALGLTLTILIIFRLNQMQTIDTINHIYNEVHNATRNSNSKN